MKYLTFPSKFTPVKKEQRDSKKNNIMKSFFGVVAFGLMCRISFYVQANKEINDMSWGNKIALKYACEMAFGIPRNS